MFLKKKKIFFVCQITVKYSNVNIKNSEDPLSTHFFKIRLKAQPGFTRVKPMGKPGERWALGTLVLRKTSDQYLATCKVSTQSINMVKRYRLTKTLTNNLLKHKISKSMTLTSRSPRVGHDGTA